ncbi:hypothetical protein [uncultured Winogradskyella sp.]|uniref:hypothetical protein n=1 Tax=uncultured Winogradskyella sp. TaxID=395353 RepID=UPI002615C3D1|nr:hypothetical protein [uncultured Winogradskyella sp.]
MNALFMYVILLLGHLCVYFYFKNNLRFLSVSNDSYTVKDIYIEKLPLKQKQDLETVSLTKKMEDNKHILLNKSLRHLEFIAEFEMYLERKTSKNFSAEFLQEFEQIKIEAQLTALKTTNQLNTIAKMAA